MHPAVKILFGALMIAVGAFVSIGPFSEEVVTLIQGGVGPLLILIGAFIVWLESDEWKMKRQEKDGQENNKTSGLQEQLKSAQSLRDKQKQEQQEQQQRQNRKIQRDYTDVLEGTVDEAKETVSNMENPSYDALIAAERRDKNRKTLIQWLERQRE